MAKPGSDRDGAMVDKQAGKKSKDKISPFTKTPKLDRGDLLGKEGKPKSSMKRKLSFTASPPRGEERDSDTDDSDPGQSGEPWGERLAPLQPCRIYADKEGPDKKKVKKEAGGKKSASANLLFGYPLSERKQMALLMQMTARDNSPDSTPSHPSPAAPLQRKLPSSTASRQRDKVNKRNERGETPLHMAAIRGDAKQVKELISLGADVNVKDFAGWTPLHEACNLGYYDVAKVLLAAGAEVNTQGLDDDTPLHDASSSGHKNILKLLLRHGGNAFQANKRGERPVDVADSLELERLLKGEAAPTDSDDSSSESEDPPSVNPSSLDDDNMDDSDPDNKDPNDKRAAAAAKASSSTSGLDEYEFKDEEEEEEDDEEEEEDVLSKALGDRHALRREGKEAGPGAERERGRNHFAAKQGVDAGGKPKKPRVPPRARCCGGTDSSSDETENPAPERRSSPTCSHGPPDPRGRKENPVLLGGAEQPRDKGKVKRKSKSLSKNKENQEDGKENSKALGFSSSVAGADATDSRRGVDDDSFKMSFSPKDDASVHLFHLASAKSPKLNHGSAADKPPTPLKQENAKACGGGGDGLDGAKYNHYAAAEQDYCTTEGSSSKGCKHKEKSKHHQRDGEGEDASPYKDAGVANSADAGEGAMRKTDKDGKVVKKHKLKHKEKDKHRRDYEVQDRNRHRPPKDAARRDGQNRNLEFDREFWKENFFKSDENDEPSPPPPPVVKKEPDDGGSSTPKHAAAVADAASSPAKEERAARDKHTGAKEKRPREERERDRGAKKERREERGKEARPAAEPEEAPPIAAAKDEPEERPVAEQDQPDTYEKVPARERYDKRLPDRKEPEKAERRHPDKDRKVKAEHAADFPQNVPERLREKERERGAGASHSPADRPHREAEKPRSASATKKNEENRRTKEKRGEPGGGEQHREKDRPKDRKLPERPDRPREKDCDKKRREKTKEASAGSNLKLLLEERRGYAPESGRTTPARAREEAAARTPEKERRDRDADRYREREKERYRERSQQGKAAKPKPAEADGTPADRAKSKASPAATPRGDPRPKEKRLVNDDLMQTSFERMLSLKDQEIEQWHRKHLEKIKQKERERLKQQRPPAPPVVDPARVRSRDRAARAEPPPCAAAAGKELLRSRSSEGPETPGREKMAPRDAAGSRTLSLDSRSLSVLGGGRLPAGAENSLSRSPRPEGECSSDLMSRSVSMVSVASSDDSCRATTPTPTRPAAEYDSDLTLEAGGDSSQQPSFLQTSSVLSLHATRSPVVHDRDGALLPDAAAQCGRTPLQSRLASPYLRAILDEDANSPSGEGKPFDVLPKAPPGGEEPPADAPRAAPPPEVSADPEAETPPCGRGLTLLSAVPPSARPDVDAVVVPESAVSVPVPAVLPPPLSDAKDSTRPLPAVGQSQVAVPQPVGVEPTGPLTSDPPVTLEVRCLPTDVPDGASKELPSVETPLLTAACLTAPPPLPPPPSSNARAPAPAFRHPSEAPLSTEAPQAEAGLDLREKNPLDGAGAENLAVPESAWGSSRAERTSSPVPPSSSAAAAGRTPSEEEPGPGRAGAEPADPREDADDHDGKRFRPAGDATDPGADPPTDKSEHVRPSSSSSASSSASPERRAEETADAPQSAEITTGDAETTTPVPPPATDKESSSTETAPDGAEPCPEPMEASSSADDGPEPAPGAAEPGQSAAAPPVDMSGGSASGSSSPQSGDRDSDSSGAKAKAARSPSDEDADMQVAAHPRKRKMPRASPPSSSSSSSSSSQACLTAPPDKDTPQQSLAAIVDSVKLEEIEPYQTERANPYYDFLHIRRKIEEKRKFLLSVIPQPPQFYDEYVTFNGSYLIDGNPLSKLCIPTITPPPSLPEQLKEMFKQQEVVRMKLRLQHSIEREKLIVSNEQEILRVHYRAARTLANQTLPFSACTVLLDAEVYNMPQDVQASGMMSHSVESGDDGKTSVRDRFNARQFMSWLQDVDDKFDKLKTCLLMRQQHEAAALNAVQRLEWQLKQQELDPALYKATSIFDISEFYIPLVEVNDDFDLTPI